MKLDCVLTAVNDNRLYLDFVPIFIKTWNKLYPASFCVLISMPSVVQIVKLKTSFKGGVLFNFILVA